MAERSVNILRPGIRGDGTPVLRDLNDFLAGKEILRVDMGAATDEGYSVIRMRFRDGDQVLILPQPVDPEVTVQTGVRLAIRILFQPKKQRRIVIPGMA